MPRVHCRNCQLRFTPSTTAAARTGLCPDCQNEMAPPAREEPRWFALLGNEMHGPNTWEELLGLAARGTISPDDMLTQEGAGHFVRARAVRGLFDGLPTAPVKHATPAEPMKHVEPVNHVTPTEPVKHESPAAVDEEPGTDDDGVDLNELLASLDLSLASRSRQKATPKATAPAPVPEPTPPPERVEIEDPAPLDTITVPSPLEESAQPAPIAEALHVSSGVEAARAPLNTKWPLLGAGTLLILAGTFFGFQWLDTADPIESTKTGFHIEEQEFREVPAKKAVPTKTEKDLLSIADRVSRVVERLNRRRKEAGLAEVMLDPTLSRACAEHAHYLARNVDTSDATPAKVYTQDPKNPDHTADGTKAAQQSLVVFEEPIQAIDRWMGRLFSRVQLLAPELERVGIGFEQNAKGVWFCVLDPVGGRDNLIKTYPVATLGTTSSIRAVVCPAPNQKNVPCIGFDRIDGAKSSVGFPISLTFPATTVVRHVQASLMDDTHNAIEVRVSGPEQPLNAKLQRTSIGIHPMRPLDPGRTYLVVVNAQVDDGEWRHVWRFTTNK